MRCLLLPVYSSFFISVISSPISSDSNDLYLEDTTTDLDLTGTQTPPPRSVSGISVAYNNVDPTTESDFKDQSGSTYVATTQQVSTVPIPSSWVAQLPDVEICKKRVKGKTVQTCMISGIDWDTLGPVLDFFGALAGAAIVSFVLNILQEIKNGNPEVLARIREALEAEEERRRKEASGEQQPDVKPDEDDRTSDNKTPDNEAFKKVFKDLDQHWLQHTVEAGLVTAGYAAQGAELTEAATAIITSLEVVGAVILL